MKTTFSDQQLIQAFRGGGHARHRAWAYAYKSWSSRVVGVIIQRGGTREEAMDAIQDAYGPFERRICRLDFELRHQLSTYFVACVCRKWARSKKCRHPPMVELDDRHVADFAESVEADIAQSELAQALDATMAHLGERCRTILRLFMEGYLMREIAEKMGFSGGEQVAKNEKRKCQERYEKFLSEHPTIVDHLIHLRHD